MPHRHNLTRQEGRVDVQQGRTGVIENQVIEDDEAMI